MAADILIVDDEADIRELVAGILEDEGFEAFLTNHGAEVILGHHQCGLGGEGSAEVIGSADVVSSAKLCMGLSEPDEGVVGRYFLGEDVLLEGGDILSLLHEVFGLPHDPGEAFGHDAVGEGGHLDGLRADDGCIAGWQGLAGGSACAAFAGVALLELLEGLLHGAGLAAGGRVGSGPVVTGHFEHAAAHLAIVGACAITDDGRVGISLLREFLGGFLAGAELTEEFLVFLLGGCEALAVVAVELALEGGELPALLCGGHGGGQAVANAGADAFGVGDA